MGTILITDITSYKASVIARYIKTHYPSHTIVATDHRNIARWACTKWVDEVVLLSNPPESGTPYVDELLTVSKNSGASLIIPVNSKEMRQLMKNKERFSPALDYWGSAETFETLDDKDAFMTLLRNLGLPHPKSFPSLVEAIAPVVLKPRRGSSSKGVRYLRSPDALAQAITEQGQSGNNCIIQQHVSGEGIGFSGYFADGKIQSGYAHRRIAEWPTTGGSSVVREQYPYNDLDTIRSYVSRIVEATRWSGFAMFEFKRTEAGELYFIECNPRIWGSINQGLECGTNYFATLLGPPERTQRAPTQRTRTELAPLSWASFLSYALNRKWRKAREVFLALWSTSYDINPLRDPLGFLALMLRGA